MFKNIITTAQNFLLVLFALFFGVYAFLDDLMNLEVLPFKGAPYFALYRLLLAVLIIFLFFLFTKIIPVNLILRKAFSQLFDFECIYPKWFSRGRVKRIEEGRTFFNNMLLKGDIKFFISSITGEWDIKQPFSEKEIRRLGLTNKLSFRILLCHPEASSLTRRAKAEEGQNIEIIKKRIIENTKYLLGLKEEFGNEVRWYINSPKFHIFASERIMFFSPFVDGISGHDTQRFAVKSDNNLYKAFQQWFDDEWDRATFPENEMSWAEQGVFRSKAVFLDRDDTLIKDLSYKGEDQEGTPARIEILPGVIEGLTLLQKNGYRLIIISNQEPVGIKIVSQDQLFKLTKMIKDEFLHKNILFDAFYYCQHSRAEKCSCQKPKGGLIEKALNDFNLDIGKCHFIGDSEKDAGVGKALPGLKVYKLTETETFLNIVDCIIADHPPTIR